MVSAGEALRISSRNSLGILMAFSEMGLSIDPDRDVTGGQFLFIARRLWGHEF